LGIIAQLFFFVNPIFFVGSLTFHLAANIIIGYFIFPKSEGSF